LMTVPFSTNTDCALTHDPQPLRIYAHSMFILSLLKRFVRHKRDLLFMHIQYSFRVTGNCP
jgi:hypothetical protein